MEPPMHPAYIYSYLKEELSKGKYYSIKGL